MLKKFLFSVISLIIFSCVGFGVYYFYSHPLPPTVQYKTEAEKNVYVRFDMEAYDSIFENYWKVSTSSEMSQLFQLSVQKAGNLPQPPVLASQDRAGVAKMLLSVINQATSTSAQKQIAIDTVRVALYNLIPVGRDQLFSSVEETALRQNVVNINPANDLYQNLGAKKGDSVAVVDQKFEEKKTALEKLNTPEAKAELSKVTYAHSVLSNQNTKSVYDQTQIEPTIFSHIIGKTLYLSIDKISPNTLMEFARAVDIASTTDGLSNMIIDLRGNIGGDLSFPQYFLGLFLGQNQYAFDLFHQGVYQTQRTVTAQFPELNRYKEYAILTDGQSQSTAELLTATLKRFRIARVVGTKTRGWGSVENTYPIKTVIDPKEKYSLLLVNSLTLREDNQPIEMNGVLPDVDTSLTGWQQKLPNYFHSTDLIKVLIDIAKKTPMK